VPIISANISRQHHLCLPQTVCAFVNLLINALCILPVSCFHLFLASPPSNPVDHHVALASRKLAVPAKSDSTLSPAMLMPASGSSSVISASETQSSVTRATRFADVDLKASVMDGAGERRKT
jgi:hypothetical protein